MAAYVASKEPLMSNQTYATDYVELIISNKINILDPYSFLMNTVVVNSMEVITVRVNC
jgi:hypothetical protein